MSTLVRRAASMLGAAGITAALATTPALAASATTASRSVVPLNDYLNTVTMTSPSSAWAVGSFELGGSVAQTLTERWNGKSWQVVPSQDPGGTIRSSSLSDVAARSSLSAWAVGSYADTAQFQQTLIERWNGSSWKQVPSPNPGGAGAWNTLSGVAYISRTAAWAVGSSGFRALVLRWNGSAWKRVSCPQPGHNSVLSRVAVLSPASAWAIGSYNPDGAPSRTLIEHWDGRSWKRVKSPNPVPTDTELADVSAVSATDIWAVGACSNGTAHQTLTEHWNGRSWKVIPSPSPAGPGEFDGLHGVSAVSASSAWAVGSYVSGAVKRTLIEHWNGRACKQVRSKDPGSSNLLAGVAATKSAAFAVGAFTSGSANLSLIERHRAVWVHIVSPNK